MNSKEEAGSGLEAHSTQLVAGQKFHHQGSNGIVYFKLSVVKMADGSLYPMTETARAGNVLPLELDAEGNVTAGYFMLQHGRPEVGARNVLKAPGSFCKKDESTEACAVRSLYEKMGIEASPEHLISVGESYGFGDQFRFPIDLFVIKRYELTEGALSPGCERIRMTIEDMAVAQRDRKFFNSETVDLVATILLRNEYRQTYAW